MFFSIIVTIYGVEKYLKRCIESILKQSFEDFELILVDDGSEDSCPQICNYYAKQDNRIRAIRKANGGLVSARNTGVKAAKGEYILYVDGDDWVPKDWAMTVYKAIESAPKQPDMVLFNATEVYNGYTAPFSNLLAPGFYNKEDMAKRVYPRLLADPGTKRISNLIQPTAWSKAYKSGLLKEHYNRNEKIVVAEDNAFTYECILYSDSIVVISDEIYYYNKQNENSIMTRKKDTLLKDHVMLVEYMQERLGDYPDENIRKQLDMLAGLLAIRGAYGEAQKNGSKAEKAENLKRQIETTGILNLVDTTHLTIKQKLVITALKREMYGAVINAYSKKQ